MNIAYLLNIKHFKDQDISFVKLQKTQEVKNIILDYRPGYTHVPAALFELKRLGINVGLRVLSDDYSEDPSEGPGMFLYNVLELVKGFDIKLGIWTNSAVLQTALSKFKDNFISGIISNDDILDFVPRWGEMGDIEDIGLSPIISIKGDVMFLRLNTNFIDIYDKNNLQPLPSNYDSSSAWINYVTTTPMVMNVRKK